MVFQILKNVVTWKIWNLFPLLMVESRSMLNLTHSVVSKRVTRFAPRRVTWNWSKKCWIMQFLVLRLEAICFSNFYMEASRGKKWVRFWQRPVARFCDCNKVWCYTDGFSANGRIFRSGKTECCNILVIVRRDCFFFFFYLLERRKEKCSEPFGSALASEPKSRRLLALPGETCTREHPMRQARWIEKRENVRFVQRKSDVTSKILRVLWIFILVNNNVAAITRNLYNNYLCVMLISKYRSRWKILNEWKSPSFLILPEMPYF